MLQKPVLTRAWASCRRRWARGAQQHRCCHAGGGWVGAPMKLHHHPQSAVQPRGGGQRAGNGFQTGRHHVGGIKPWPRPALDPAPTGQSRQCPRRRPGQQGWSVVHRALGGNGGDRQAWGCGGLGQQRAPQSGAQAVSGKSMGRVRGRHRRWRPNVSGSHCWDASTKEAATVQSLRPALDSRPELGVCSRSRADHLRSNLDQAEGVSADDKTVKAEGGMHGPAPGIGPVTAAHPGIAQGSIKLAERTFGGGKTGLEASRQHRGCINRRSLPCWKKPKYFCMPRNFPMLRSVPTVVPRTPVGRSAAMPVWFRRWCVKHGQCEPPRAPPGRGFNPHPGRETPRRNTGDPQPVSIHALARRVTARA